jgi:hypothetical protein
VAALHIPYFFCISSTNPSPYSLFTALSSCQIFLLSFGLLYAHFFKHKFHFFPILLIHLLRHICLKNIILIIKIAFPLYRLEKRLSLLDAASLDVLRVKATALRSELEAASKIKSSQGQCWVSSYFPTHLPDHLLTYRAVNTIHYY